MICTNITCVSRDWFDTCCCLEQQVASSGDHAARVGQSPRRTWTVGQRSTQGSNMRLSTRRGGQGHEGPRSLQASATDPPRVAMPSPPCHVGRLCNGLNRAATASCHATPSTYDITILSPIYDRCTRWLGNLFKASNPCIHKMFQLRTIYSFKTLLFNLLAVVYRYVQMENI